MSAMNDMKPRSATRPRIWPWLACAVALAGLVTLFVATRLSMRDFPEDLESLSGAAVKPQVLARDGTPLSFTLQNRWNTTDVQPLEKIPALLQAGVITSEDQHLYARRGVDWASRVAAFWLDLRKLNPVRGASSITEQVV